MEVLSSRILIRPHDLERSLQFYGSVLGLPVYREFGSGTSRGVVFFLGGGFLELSGSGEGVGGDDVKLWLQVRSVQQARADLQRQGVAIEEGPEQKPWGLHEMTVRDPDGIGLVFVEVPAGHPLRRDVRSGSGASS